MEYTGAQLDAEMHHAGVDAALLHTDPMMVRSSEPLRDICDEFPGRMWALIPAPLLLPLARSSDGRVLASFAMAPVDEWRIPTEGPAIIAALRTAVREHRLHAVKFIPPLCHIAGDFTPWDDGPCTWSILPLSSPLTSPARL